MTKILLVTLDFYPKLGGVANYYFNLCLRLESKKISVLTVKGINKQANKKNESCSFKIYRKNLLIKFIWPKWLPMFWHVWRIAKQEKIKLIWAGEVLPTGIVVYFLSKILKIPYIVSCHGNDILQIHKKARKKKFARKILQNAKYVIVNSNYTSGLVKKIGVIEDNVKVIYPGIESLKHENTQLRLQPIRGQVKALKQDLIKKLENKKVLLSVGRLVERKGFDKVIMALPKVWNEIPDLIYIIVGDGYDKYRLQELSEQSVHKFKNLEILQHKSNIKDKILFLGSVDEKQKNILYNLCNVFIMPARESQDDVEGFGIVYLEAASHAKPVIAGKCGGASEAVLDGETGILVDGKDVNKIARTIIRLFKDRELRERLGRRGKKRAEDEFAWDKSVEKFKALII